LEMIVKRLALMMPHIWSFVQQVTILVAAEGEYKLPTISSNTDLKDALRKLGSIPVDAIQVWCSLFSFITCNPYCCSFATLLLWRCLCYHLAFHYEFWAKDFNMKEFYDNHGWKMVKAEHHETCFGRL
jgi:hypothetical protein